MLRSKLSPGTRCALEHGGMAPTFITQSADLDLSTKLLIEGFLSRRTGLCFCAKSFYS